MVRYEILNMKIFNQLLSLIDQLLFLVNIGCHLEKCFPGRRDIHENIFSSSLLHVNRSLKYHQDMIKETVSNLSKIFNQFKNLSFFI